MFVLLIVLFIFVEESNEAYVKKIKMNSYNNSIKYGLYFNNEKLTQTSIDKCIIEMIQNQQGCIDEVLSGEVRVNDKENYFKQCNVWADRYRNRDFKITLTFLQHTYYIQTGESIALLP